jgi:DNA-binding winged helix-turn-helix (wHTH) protein
MTRAEGIMMTSALRQTRCVPPNNGQRPRPPLITQCAEALAPPDDEGIAYDVAHTPTVPFGGSAKVFSFGPFRLLPAERLLTENGRPVRLGSRAFDILVILVERAGNVVAKNDIMTRVWPSTIVVEDNLSVHMTALRRVLQDGRNGNRYIVTIPGRGYSFVAQLAQVAQETQFSRLGAAVGRTAADALTHERHRDRILAELVAKISRQRDLTIVEPDGFVRVPLALAEALIALCRRDSFVLDLAGLQT